jgi:hypothetical protein
MRRSVLLAVVTATIAGCTPSAPPPTPPPALATLGTLAPTSTFFPTVVGPVVGDVSPARVLQAADGGYEAYGYGMMAPARVAEVLQPPCAGAAGPSEALLDRRASATMAYRYRGPNSTYDGTVDEVLTRYRADGAARLITEWRMAVATCPHLDLDPVTADNAIVASGFAGPDSILVTTVRSGPTSRDDPLRFSATDYTALVRIGDAMIVLRVGPWETGSPRRADVDRLIGAALTRATA